MPEDGGVGSVEGTTAAGTKDFGQGDGGAANRWGSGPSGQIPRVDTYNLLSVGRLTDSGNHQRHATSKAILRD